MIDAVLWYTGLVTWTALSVAGMLFMLDHALDLVITTFWARKECIAFVCDRLRKRKRERDSG